MNEFTITSAQYVARPNDSSVNDHIDAVIDGVTMNVPLDPDNRHYAALLEWVADSNTIQDAS